MKNGDLELMIKVARMYYEDNMKQEAVSLKMGLSRPKVSRLISKAKELGYVKTIIIDPNEVRNPLEKKLQNMLKLKDVRIASPRGKEDVKTAVGSEGAKYLSSILKPGDIIGVSWGVTMKHMVESIDRLNIENITVVQLKGSIPHGDNDDISYFAARKLGEKLSAKVRYLNVPVMVKTRELKEELLKEPGVKSTSELGKKANIAIFSIGYPSKQSTISNCGYITGKELEYMRHDGAAGEICSRFFDEYGIIYDDVLDARNTSIDLSNLRDKEYSIGMASGVNSAYAVMGAAEGGYINRLILDEKTAQKIIEIKES